MTERGFHEAADFVPAIRSLTGEGWVPARKSRLELGNGIEGAGVLEL